jgi:hypothetical protein
MKKRPDTDYEILDKEKIVLKQGYRVMPPEHFEIMVESENNERNKR